MGYSSHLRRPENLVADVSSVRLDHCEARFCLLDLQQGSITMVKVIEYLPDQ